MKTIIATICFLSMGAVGASAQTEVPQIPLLPGWSNLPGDEFEGTEVDKSIWGLYGDRDRNYYYETFGNNTSQGMAQTYRDNMVTVNDGILTVRATRDAIETGLRNPGYTDPTVDYSVIPRYPLKPQHDYTKIGWWSGALSSRDVDKYYPLYSRIEVKAKIPYEIGVWMALWLRHRNGGASTFEIDLEEFFVHDDDANITNSWEGHTYEFKGKKTIHQSVHGLTRYKDSDNNIKVKNTYNLNPFSERVREISFDPSADYHVYGAQIDPLPGDSATHFAVSFLLDGRVRSVFSTKEHKIEGTSIYKYNEMLKDEYIKGDIDHIWDVAITGGIGGKPDGNGGGILYPELDPQYGGDLNKVPRNYEMNIDWLRVYKRASQPLWLGSVPVSWDWKAETAEVTIPAERFADLRMGDQLVMDFDPLSVSEYRNPGKPALDIYNAAGTAITTVKPEITQNDAQVTFVIDNETLLNELKTNGCVVKGKNIRLFSVCRYSAANTKWAGFKQIKWGESLIPAVQFSNLTEGQKLELTVRDVSKGSKVYLRLFADPAPDKHDRPNLSSDKKYGHIVNLDEGVEEKTYTVELSTKGIQELKEYGLAVTGNGYYLRSVRILGEEKEPTAINSVVSHQTHNNAVYSLTGIKVANSFKEGTLAPGIYLVGGRKVVVK